jgi:hypothetical protein
MKYDLEVIPTTPSNASSEIAAFQGVQLVGLSGTASKMSY